MSQIESEIRQNMEEGKNYASWAKRGLVESLRSLGSLIGVWKDQPGWIPDQRDTAGRVTGWRRTWEPRLGARPGLYSKLRAYLKGV